MARQCPPALCALTGVQPPLPARASAQSCDASSLSNSKAKASRQADVVAFSRSPPWLQDKRGGQADTAVLLGGRGWQGKRR